MNIHRGICKVCMKLRWVNSEGFCFWCFDKKTVKEES